MKKLLSILACVLALAICLTACGNSASSAQSPALGGILSLRVNPEIAIRYDADGNVTEVMARNDDGSKIVADYRGYEGKSCQTVVSELVTAIGAAGYFVEEIDGERRQITLELEKGSVVPSESFLEEVAAKVRETINENSWTTPVAIDDHATACTNPYCDDDDCDDLICDEGTENDVRTCTNPHCDDDDCDDLICDEGPENDVRTCTNPYCDDDDCDDLICDEGPEDNS